MEAVGGTARNSVTCDIDSHVTRDKYMSSHLQSRHTSDSSDSSAAGGRGEVPRFLDKMWSVVPLETRAVNELSR